VGISRQDIRGAGLFVANEGHPFLVGFSKLLRQFLRFVKDRKTIGVGKSKADMGRTKIMRVTKILETRKKHCKVREQISKSSIREGGSMTLRVINY